MARTSFIALLGPLTTLTSAAPTLVPFDTTNSTPNPAYALLARDGTAVAFKNIWLNCNFAIVSNDRDADVYFCGHNDQMGDRSNWIKPRYCLSLCTCNCRSQVTCRAFKQCSKEEVLQECIKGAPWSLGCFCDDGKFWQPPKLTERDEVDEVPEANDTTKLIIGPAPPLPSTVIRC